MPHAAYIIYFFVFGACVGSFLNVVVWRLPRGESLIRPPSHCPKCNRLLSWRDNIPVFGWLLLRGKCRYCKAPISARYPTIEAVTGGLFALYYVMFFIVAGPYGAGIEVIQPRTALGGIHVATLTPLPFELARDWPVYAMAVFLVSGLLAASLIDGELFIIPLEIPWLTAAVAFPFHAFFASPRQPYSINTTSPLTAALAAGAGIGLLVTILLWWRRVLPTSFPQGEPMLEIDRDELVREIALAKREGRTLTAEETAVPPSYTKTQIRAEMRKEMLFLMPALVLGGIWVLATEHVAGLRHWWTAVSETRWVSGLLGAVLGALVGGFVVWVFRILGTLGFGRVAMGLGDVHLMFGVGAVMGAGAATVAFFLAPFFGIVVALYMLCTGTRRELPYGPYLSLATAVVMLGYWPVASYLSPGLTSLAMAVRSLIAR